MVKSLEKTLEFDINVSDLEVDYFSEKVMDDFEANPYGIRHFGGHLFSEPGTEGYSKFYINVIFQPSALCKSKELMKYMKSNGYACHYLENNRSKST